MGDAERDSGAGEAAGGQGVAAKTRKRRVRSSPEPRVICRKNSIQTRAAKEV